MTYCSDEEDEEAIPDTSERSCRVMSEFTVAVDGNNSI